MKGILVSDYAGKGLIVTDYTRGIIVSDYTRGILVSDYTENRGIMVSD